MRFSSFLLIAASLLLALSSCDKRDIRQVVKEMSESPVDTVGMLRTSVLTNDFSAVQADCFADITFHQTHEGEPTHVVVQASREVLPHVRVSTDGSTLNLSTERTYRMPENAVVVANIYAPYASRFSLNGAKCLRLGNLRVSSPLRIEVFGGIGAVTSDSVRAEEIALWLRGEGSIDLRGISTHRLTAELKGNGRIILERPSRQKNHFARTRSTVDAAQLQAK